IRSSNCGHQTQMTTPDLIHRVNTVFKASCLRGCKKNSSIEQEYRDISSMCTAAQMEILELELRARAIRSLMSAKARDATAKTTAAPSSNSSGGYGQH
ncbi:hypothetical protein MRX96_048478, partial [Rhipicephalus microplus]